MKTRQVTLRVVCDLPEDVSTVELKEYVQEAIKTYGGSLAIQDPFSDKKLRNNMKVLGKYKRQVL